MLPDSRLEELLCNDAAMRSVAPSCTVATVGHRNSLRQRLAPSVKAEKTSSRLKGPFRAAAKAIVGFS